MKMKIIIASLAIAAALTGGIAYAQTTGSPNEELLAQIQTRVQEMRTQLNNLFSRLGIPSPVDRVVGTVKSVSGTAIVVAANGIEYTVNTANAAITKNGAAAGLADIKVGDYISAQGPFVENSSTAINATRINATDSNSKSTVVNSNSRVYRGTISSIAGSSFTLQSFNKGMSIVKGANAGTTTSTTITTDSNTVFKKNGQKITISDLTTGQQVIVTATKNDAGTILAKTVMVISMGPGASAMNAFLQHGVSGTVKSVSGTTIVVTAHNGVDYTIDASSATVAKSDRTSAQLSDIQSGNMIMVSGTVSGTNIAAKQIYIVANGGATGVSSITSINGIAAMFNDLAGYVSSIDGTNQYGDTVTMPVIMFNGTVKSISGTTLIVAGYNNTDHTVDASQATVIDKNSQKASLSIVQSGDNVMVAGKTSGTTINATLIADLSK